MSVDAIIKNFFKKFACSCCFFAQARPAAERAARRAPLRPPRLDPSGRHHPTPSAALRQPLCRPSPWTPLLHHPSRVPGRGYHRQPPQGLHGRGCHDWQPASPRQTARFAPRRSCRNQVGLVFRPTGLFTFSSGAATRWSQKRFPTWQGGFCTPGTGGTITGATDAVPVPSTGTTTEVGSLTFSLPGQGQSEGGALWTPAYTPGEGQTSWVSSNNPVLHLYISCYVTVNKPVQSYLSLRLLPQVRIYYCEFSKVVKISECLMILGRKI
jgi:hypothetical protein